MKGKRDTPIPRQTDLQPPRVDSETALKEGNCLLERVPKRGSEDLRVDMEVI